MKVLPFTIPKPKRDSLILQEDKGLSFYASLHQHEELQISYIKQGEGTLLVGDTVSFYRAGDIIVLGENLPHVFKSDVVKSDVSIMLSIFFTKHSFGSTFFDTEELKSLRSFFKKAENGFKISNINSSISSPFEKLYAQSKLDRFITFFTLLKGINKQSYESLSSFVSTKKYNDAEGKRMSAVFEYTINNYQREISLAVIAREAAMTKNAFCKYFKKRTNKTYVTFLNELRIEEACKMLQTQQELSVAEVAESSGFQNISNFNRKFKGLKGKTPREYRKVYNP